MTAPDYAALARRCGEEDPIFAAALQLADLIRTGNLDGFARAALAAGLHQPGGAALRAFAFTAGMLARALNPAAPTEDEDAAAARAEAELCAAAYAWRRIAALSDPGTPDPPWTEPPAPDVVAAHRAESARAVAHEAARTAAVIGPQLDSAELHIRRTYASEAELARLHTLAVDMLTRGELDAPDGPDGPGPGAEDHRRDDGRPL